MNFTVAMLQLEPHVNGEDACRRAAALDADIALFPEMWNVGYASCSEELAVSSDSDFVDTYRRLARQLDIAIGITYLESPGPRNSLLVIDRHGNDVLHYSKVHTCDFGMEAALMPGDEFRVATLSTNQGEVEIGAMICYDREFPESARTLMLKGAEVILVPNACELEINRMSQVRARAFENMTAIAVTNYASAPYNGRSVAFDGMAFGENGSRDMLIAEGGQNEEIVLATFDIDALRTYRGRETWGDAYRKPATYQTDISMQDVFRREDSRR